MGTYKKKPIEVEAVKWTGDNKDEIRQLALRSSRDTAILFNTQGHVTVRTLEGVMRLNIGDWLVKGVRNELYPVHNDIFVATYEKAE